MKRITKAWKETVVAKFMTAQTWEQLKSVYLEYITEEHTEEQEKWFDICFENCAAIVGNKHVNKNGEMYEKETDDKTSDYTEVVKMLLKIEDITLEQCGSWLYIGGKTKEHLEEIHAVGDALKANEDSTYYTKFCKGQKMWAVIPKSWKPRGGKRRSWTHAKVQQTYGSKMITEEETA